MSGIPQPREPVPEEFGITATRIRYFRGVLENDPIPIVAFGLPIIAITIIGANRLLPHSLASFIDPFWRFVLPAALAAYLIGAIQSLRQSIARNRADYPKFTSYQNAMQTYKKAMGTYHYLQREHRHDELRRKRHQATLKNGESRAQWRGIKGRDFEVEVVEVLFSKGYDVVHTGASSNGDQGIDFVVRCGGKKIIGQCKAHKSYLSAGPVRELYGTLLHEKADEAWLVGTSGFYSGAKSFAYGKPIRLLTIHKLLRLPEVERGVSNNSGDPDGATNESRPIRAESNRASSEGVHRR
jgi:HJR/Mrr/RecB family endonuclease